METGEKIEYPTWKWEVFVGFGSVLFLVISLVIRMTGMLSMYLILLLFISMMWTVLRVAYQKIKKTFPTIKKEFLSGRREKMFFCVAIIFWSLTIISGYLALSAEILGQSTLSFLLFVLFGDLSCFSCFACRMQG